MGEGDAHADGRGGAAIEAGWPAMGAEIVPGETIPAETGVTDVAVDFRKGCYPGPGAGRADGLPRRVARRAGCASLDVADGAAPGDPIVVDGVEVGRLTSVAGTRALGYVKRRPLTERLLREGDDVRARWRTRASSGAWSMTVASPSAPVSPSAAARSQATAVSSSPSAPAARATVAASIGCGLRP